MHSTVYTVLVYVYLHILYVKLHRGFNVSIQLCITAHQMLPLRAQLLILRVNTLFLFTTVLCTTAPGASELTHVPKCIFL